MAGPENPGQRYANDRTGERLHLCEHGLLPCPPQLGERTGKFAEALFTRTEKQIVVAAHSAFLLAIFNAVFVCDQEDTRLWFGTGEMRTVLLTCCDKRTPTG